GEIARSATAVQDLHIAAEGAKPCLLEHVRELLEELIDLRVLRAPGGPNVAVARQDAHDLEQPIRLSFRERDVLEPVMSLRTLWRGRYRLPPSEEDLAFFCRADVHFFGARRKVDTGKAHVEDL